MLLDGGSEICLMSDVVAREFNIKRRCANWRMISDSGNRSNFTNVAESVPINLHGIVIPIPIILANSRSEQVILGCHWKTYTRKWKRNLDDRSCEITISAINRLEQVMFVATF
jgi:hypothetical protein